MAPAGTPNSNMATDPFVSDASNKKSIVVCPILIVLFSMIAGFFSCLGCKIPARNGQTLDLNQEITLNIFFFECGSMFLVSSRGMLQFETKVNAGAGVILR